MKIKDIKALHQKDVATLQKEVAELISQLSNAKLQAKVGKLANPSLIKVLGDDIARYKTVISEVERKS